jgi:hypothetical protein
VKNILKMLFRVDIECLGTIESARVLFTQRVKRFRRTIDVCIMGNTLFKRVLMWSLGKCSHLGQERVLVWSWGEYLANRGVFGLFSSKALKGFGLFEEGLGLLV